MIVLKTLSLSLSRFPYQSQQIFSNKQHRYEVKVFLRPYSYEIKMKRMQGRQHVRRRDEGKKGSRRKSSFWCRCVLCIIHIGEERTEINNVDRLSDWSGVKEGFDIPHVYAYSQEKRSLFAPKMSCFCFGNFCHLLLFW